MIDKGCLSAQAIADLVDGGEATKADERHVRACAACSRRVSLVRRARSAGIDPIGDAVAEIDNLAAQLESTPRHAWWKLVREADFQRPDVARRILALVLDARLRDPRRALDLANAATTIVDTLPLSHESAGVRFDAWMYTASLLREAARYAEAERALKTAEEAAYAVTDPELALASVWLSRALLSAEPDVWQIAEASALLDQAEAVFARRSDDLRIQAVLTARAFLLYRSGDLLAARQQFAELVDVALTRDREAYLNAVSNLMWVRVELREAEPEVEAMVHLLINENLSINRAVQVARARWMMGRINLARGDYDHAVHLFRSAMADIEDSDASIRIGLDAAEALLLGGRHSEGLHLARELASAAVALDQREPSRRRALTAQVLAYLKAAAQRQAWTPDLVADLARYIDRITRQRPFDFVPPMPLAEM